MTLSMSSTLILEPGRDEPFGAQARDGGVNFAVWSEHATRVELCVFDAKGETEVRRFDLLGPRHDVWSGFLHGAAPGLVYGLRVHGPDAPDHGHRFNANTVLLDPYAREIVTSGIGALLRARVAAPPQRRERPVAPPRHDATTLRLYEVHVKGFTRLHPEIPAELRGTYLGMAHPSAVAHLHKLGINAVSLLPIQHHLDESFATERGLTNYWGYNTLGFFAADPRFSTQPDNPGVANDEFRRMVIALHEQGIAVILDVVFNHTPEGDHRGPTLSWRGIDNANWYTLVPHDRAHYLNHSGCGNTLNVAHPRVAQFVMDSLRFWVDQMGVDGFRFDLAPVLGRGPDGFDERAPFFVALQQDPLLARAHWIAEPWDNGPDGYQLGRFPGRFLEWNDKFRDTMRAYWLHRGVDRGQFVRRFFASNDVFHHRRRPAASINFVAVHDGFTLADTVSYSHKHNQANGEDNRDGRDGEACHNFGIEGPTSDPSILQTRQSVQRAMLATMLLAQGTPMLAAGDELGRSQQGNNNAWCQDKPLNWIDWDKADKDLVDFCASVLALRSAEPALSHRGWFEHDHGTWRLRWQAPAGHDMQIADWHRHDEHALACMVLHAPAQEATTPTQQLQPHLWLAFNPHAEPQSFKLPPGHWALVLDSSATATPSRPADATRTLSKTFEAPAHSLVVLRSHH
jgi:isoamylase